MGSRLVEQETAANLDLLVLAELHLVQEIDCELCSLFLVHLFSEAWALKIGYRDHVIVKLPGLSSVRSDDDSVEEVADAGVVDLNCQVLYDSGGSVGIKHDLPNPRSCVTRWSAQDPPPFSREDLLSALIMGEYCNSGQGPRFNRQCN